MSTLLDMDEELVAHLCECVCTCACMCTEREVRKGIGYLCECVCTCACMCTERGEKGHRLFFQYVNTTWHISLVYVFGNELPAIYQVFKVCWPVRVCVYTI